MEIYIPSSRLSFTLEFTAISKKPVMLRIQARDLNKPLTFYANRKGRVDGKRTFELKMPISPKEMELKVYNIENGNLPEGYDDSFEITDVKVKKLATYDVWWDEKTKDFYKFACWFSQNAGILSSEFPKPHIYRSNNGEFTFDYYNRIVDKKGKVLNTPARIGHNSGIIEIAADKFRKYTVPMRLVILLHEFSHKWLNPKIGRKIEDESSADINALYIYLGKGFSELEAHQAFLFVFKGAKNDFNHKRYKIINDFIGKFNKGLIASPQ